MRTTTVLNKLLALQGLWVRGSHLLAEAREVWIFVVPRWRVSRCGGCGDKVERRHDRTGRSWRHLDLLGWTRYLALRHLASQVPALRGAHRAGALGGARQPVHTGL